MQSETEERERWKKEMRLSLCEESTTFRKSAEFWSPQVPSPPPHPLKRIRELDHGNGVVMARNIWLSGPSTCVSSAPLAVHFASDVCEKRPCSNFEATPSTSTQ